jgi:hypothetical protein
MRIQILKFRERRAKRAMRQRGSLANIAKWAKLNNALYRASWGEL